MALAGTPLLALAAESTATKIARVYVYQKYAVNASGLKNTFEYLIVPLEANAPLPTDSSGNTFSTFSLTRDQTLWLNFPIEVTADPSATPFSYHYTLKPAEESLPNGLYYVDEKSTDLAPGINVYYLEIHVQPANEDADASVVTPLVHISGWDGDKETDPGWRIAYKEKAPSPSPSENSSGNNTNPNPTDESSGNKTASDGTSSTSGSTTSSDKTSTTSTSVGTSGNTSGTTTSGTTQTVTQTTRTSLATTGDPISFAIVGLCGILGISLLLVRVPLRRPREGEDDA